MCENLEVRLLYSTKSFHNFDKSIGDDVDICTCVADTGVCDRLLGLTTHCWAFNLVDKSLLQRPFRFDGRWVVWLTSRPSRVGWSSSLSAAPVSGLISDGCSGHARPWLSDRAGWPPSALTLASFFSHQLNTPLPNPKTLPEQSLISGLYSCRCSSAPPSQCTQTHYFISVQWQTFVPQSPIMNRPIKCCNKI